MEQTVLIVEGQDEVRLCKALTANDTRPPHIREAGKHKLTSNLIAILKDIERAGPISRLAIIRDADDDAQRAFKSVCSSITAAELQPPPQHGSYSSGETSVGVFIAPDGRSNGAIEALIRQSVAADAEAVCAADYLDCLCAGGVLHAKDHDKSFVHAYLSSQTDPLLRVGEAAEKGVWNFDQPAFAPLRRFLRSLAG